MLARYSRVLLPENNMGQLQLLLRGRYLKDITGDHRVTGQPFRAAELCEQILDLAGDREGAQA